MGVWRATSACETNIPSSKGANGLVCVYIIYRSNDGNFTFPTSGVLPELDIPGTVLVEQKEEFRSDHSCEVRSGLLVAATRQHGLDVPGAFRSAPDFGEIEGCPIEANQSVRLLDLKWYVKTGYAPFIVDELVFDLVMLYGPNQHRTTGDARCLGGLMARNHVRCDDFPFDLVGVFELLDQFVLSVHIEEVDLEYVSITNITQPQSSP